MDSPVAQLVEHLKLNQEVLGSFPSWGIRFFPPRQQHEKGCQRFIIISQLYTSSLDEPYSLKTNSSTTGCTSYQTCRFGCKHILKATGWWPLLFGRRGMDSPVAQLVEHLKLNWEVLGSFPSWGIRFFPPRWQHEKDCQRFIIISQLYTSSLDEPYSLKMNSSTTGCTSYQTCRFGCKHILKATGWWPLLFGRRGMDSPVAQLIEHSKLNREVPGSFPGWGIRFFFLLGDNMKKTVRGLL